MSESERLPHPVVRAENLTIGYKNTSVISNLSFELPFGSSLALCGGNGSGKSTLLKTMAGLLPPISGTIEVLNAPPGKQPRRVAYVGQFHNENQAFPLRVKDLVLMGRYPHRGLLRRFKKVDKQLSMQALEQLEATHLANRPVRDLSGGQRQRVYLAQALTRQADLLLFDEPATGLDPVSMGLYRKAIAQTRAKGTSIVIATHDFKEARSMDIAMLLSRVLIGIGPPATVFTKDNLTRTFGVSLTETAGDTSPNTFAVETHHHHQHHDDEEITRPSPFLTPPFS